MSERKYSPAYALINGLIHPFRNGNIIIGDTLFQIEKGTVTASYPVSGKTIEEKVKDAREQANLSNRKRIFVDTEGIFDEYAVADEGVLVTSDEFFDNMSEEERDDYESFVEYFFNKN